MPALSLIVLAAILWGSLGAASARAVTAPARSDFEMSTRWSGEPQIVPQASPSPVTTAPAPHANDADPDTATPDDETVPSSTTTSVPPEPEDEVVPGSTPQSIPEPTTPGTDEPETTEEAPPPVAAPAAPFRPSTSPNVRDSPIPLGSIALALAVLAGVGFVTIRVIRRRPATGEKSTSRARQSAAQSDSEHVGTPSDEAAEHPGSPSAVDASTSAFLLAVGEALMEAGAPVGHVESMLQGVARSMGTGRVGVLVLPNALMVSVPNGNDLVTEIGAPGRVPLRLDQMDDLLVLVRQAESGEIGVAEGTRRLAAIRSTAAPYSPALVLFGHVCATIGLAALLNAGWVEVLLAGLLGVMVGIFRMKTRPLHSIYHPFVVLVAAITVAATVFACTRFKGDLLTFPLLIAPLTTFLPGGLLTIGVLELATGQIVSGTSRLASGGLQLVLLALGLVAGAQLVGVPADDVANVATGPVGVFMPWIGVAMFGIGLVWFYGARSSARPWILLMMFVAYAGQVIGGLLFGSTLSAFFGAFALTPVAVLAARHANAPSPLVTILPGFWLLVPGALGLEGVTRLFGAGGAAASGVLTTTLTSLVGVALGVLLGLLLVASDPDRPWSEVDLVRPAEPPQPDDDRCSPTETID